MWQVDLLVHVADIHHWGICYESTSASTSNMSWRFYSRSSKFDILCYYSKLIRVFVRIGTYFRKVPTTTIMPTNNNENIRDESNSNSQNQKQVKTDLS